jgi:hypothetical protein
MKNNLKNAAYSGEEQFPRSDITFSMQSFQSLLDARCGIDGRNPEDWTDWTILVTAQQVLKVALLFPVLGRKIFFSSCEGAWDRVRERLVPLETRGRPNERVFLEQSQKGINLPSGYNLKEEDVKWICQKVRITLKNI